MLLVEHAIERVALHRARQRGERAVGDAVDRRLVGRVDPDRGQRGRLGEEGRLLLVGDDPVDGLVEAAVSKLVDPGLTLAATFAIFLLVLLLRPAGLFGKASR